MPNVNVLRSELFEAVGKTFTDEAFEDLCFQFGLELEIGDAEEMQMTRNDDSGNAIDISKQIVYKIEVAANRYDLLCLEGIAEAFRAYLDLGKAPRYTVKNHSENLHEIIVKSETAAVRPCVAACVLRNVTFDIKSYNSFIDLQDKLHHNICRRRTLASMGTHDLDKFANDAPITYEAHKPEDIKFQALKQSKEMNCVELFDVFKTDAKLKKFLPILEGHEKYPVFYDKNRQVLSLPPIINSESTKISINTKNVFIEVTGTDMMKTKICLAILAAQFSQYCASDSQHTVEQVKVTYEDDRESEITPTMAYLDFECELAHVRRLLGIDVSVEKAKECLEKMGLVLKGSSEGKLQVEVPPTRSDILHSCDVVEDIGIGYGFNNITPVYPPTNTVGSYQPNNKFSDLLRQELAQASYIEQLTFGLISLKDAYERMRMPIDEKECVQISNPKTLEFEVVRPSLLPGLLKCLQSNKKEAIPQKVFEITDVCVLDPATETGGRNERRIAAMVLDHSSNFEVVHGLLDLLMTKICAKMGTHYVLKEDLVDPRWMNGRGVSIWLNNQKIGSMGVIHPEVLNHFELKYPVSALELDFTKMFDHFKALW